MSVVVIDT